MKSATTALALLVGIVISNPAAACSAGVSEKLTSAEVLALAEFGHLDFYYKSEIVKVSADAVADFFNKE